MNRRQFISGTSALSVTTTGCLSTVRSDSSTKQRRIAVESSDDVRIEGTSMTVGVTDETITRDSSGKIRVSLMNTGGYYATYICGFRPPFSGIANAREDRDEVSWYPFHPTKHHPTRDNYDRPDGCGWSIYEDTVRFGDINAVDLDPGESVSIELDLVANGDLSECRPTGTFRVADYKSVKYGDQERPFEWGFSLTITADG